MARHKRRKHSNPRRRSRRSHRRSYHRNPLSLGGASSLLAPALWGGAGYLAAKLGASVARRYVPNMIPAPDLVAAVAAGAAVSWAGGMVASGSNKEALRVGAMIPTVEAAVNMTSLGSMLGTQKVVMLAPPSGQPSSGVQAALAAALSADLNDDYSNDY